MKPIERAKIAWKHVTWMDKMNYGSFEKYFETEDWKKVPDKPHVSGDTFNGIILISIFLIVFYFAFIGVQTLYKKTNNYFEGANNLNDFCSRSSKVLNAKTEFAAKKAYKACMKRK